MTSFFNLPMRLGRPAQKNDVSRTPPDAIFAKNSTENRGIYCRFDGNTLFWEKFNEKPRDLLHFGLPISTNFFSRRVFYVTFAQKDSVVCFGLINSLYWMFGAKPLFYKILWGENEPTATCCKTLILCGFRGTGDKITPAKGHKYRGLTGTVFQKLTDLPVRDERNSTKKRVDFYILHFRFASHIIHITKNKIPAATRICS